MRQQIQKFIWKLLERELITILAVSFIGLAIVFTKADSANTTLNFSIIPAGGTVTVTDPNGGESWTIGTSYNITWDSAGEVVDVKIELQRTVGGSWETITASTTSDGSHPWTVTSPAATTAKIKITEVGDDTVTDQSDAVFTIAAASTGGGGHRPGSGVATAPMIDLVTPRDFSNNSAVTLTIKGSYLEFGAKVYLGAQELSVPTNLGYEMRATVPLRFSAGQYQLKVINPTGATGIYGTLITVTDNPYEGVVVDQSTSPINLLPGEKSEAWVKVKNLSNYTWVGDGNNQIQLRAPGDRASLFYDPASWLLNYQAARMEESSVAYGQTGTFRFYIKAPAKVGDYTDSFSLVIENIKWLNLPAISWRVVVKSAVRPPTTGGIEYYADRLIKQSPNLNRIELAPGQEATLWADFENTGLITWTADGNHPVRIGTEKKRDRPSRFRGKNWVLKDRPSNVESTTPPGGVGRFTINIKAPSRVGTYKEYFGLVAEHKTWITGDLVSWEIVVKKPAKKSAIVKAPSTGGAPTWTPSNQAVLFVDGTEKLFSQIAQGVSDLWGSITKLFAGF